MAGELKIDARRNRILEILRRDGQVRVSALSDALGVTLVTIRSDLTALEQDGYLERTQGGAIQTTKNYYNMEFQRRKCERAERKKAIAYAASNLVQDGNTLFINSGTTTCFTAVELKRRKNLNVVTNSVTVAMELSDVPTFRIILLGGECNAQYSFTYGDNAKEQLSRYSADWAILSIDGVDPDAGLTTYHAEEATIDRMMLTRAKRSMIVADSSKLGHASFSRVADLSDVDTWVTDGDADNTLFERIREHGITIRYA